MKAPVMPDSASDAELVREALRQALRQWRMYAELEEGRELDHEDSPEALLYRSCLSRLASLSRQEGWRPINEAELNCDVLAFWEKSNTMEVAERSEHVNEHGHSWLVDGDFVSNPTHWMPLPAPPPPGASS